MSKLRSACLKIAAELPKGDSTRQALLAAVREASPQCRMAAGVRNSGMQKELEKKLKAQARRPGGLYVLDQGWSQGGQDISPDKWQLILGRGSNTQKIVVGDNFTYDQREDEYETRVTAVIIPADAQAAAGLNAKAEDGVSTMVERSGKIYLSTRGSVPAGPTTPEGQGVHYW